MRIRSLIFFALIVLASCSKENNNDLIKGDWVYLETVTDPPYIDDNHYKATEPYNKCNIWSFLDTEIILTDGGFGGERVQCDDRSMLTVSYRMPNPLLIYVEYQIDVETPYDISFSSDTMKFKVRYFVDQNQPDETLIFIKP